MQKRIIHQCYEIVRTAPAEPDLPHWGPILPPKNPALFHRFNLRSELVASPATERSKNRILFLGGSSDVEINN